MGFWEIFLIVACSLFVVGVVTAWIIRKKKGKCGCDCCDCAHCSKCASHSQKEQPK